MRVYLTKEFHGTKGKTPAGQVSLFATIGKVLSPCLRPIPSTLNVSTSILTQNRQDPILDLLVNPTSMQILKTRSRIVAGIRDYLQKRGFLEVETPILAALAGGANARPFMTRMEALDLDLSLRIAPELYLKQLVVGGVEKVFEIGKQFRNEGIDATHNPEFTTCEFYEAYKNLDQLMIMTQDFLEGTH